MHASWLEMSHFRLLIVLIRTLNLFRWHRAFTCKMTNLTTVVTGREIRAYTLRLHPCLLHILLRHRRSGYPLRLWVLRWSIPRLVLCWPITRLLLRRPICGLILYWSVHRPMLIRRTRGSGLNQTKPLISLTGRPTHLCLPLFLCLMSYTGVLLSDSPIDQLTKGVEFEH